MKRMEWLMIVVNNHGAEERPNGGTSKKLNTPYHSKESKPRKG
jgi:hypothetical protein